MYRINRLDPRETQAIDSVITLFPPISTSTVYTQCLMICTCTQHMEYSLQSSVITPFVEATVNALVRRITIGHILPSWTTVSKPKNGIEHGFIIPFGWSTSFSWEKQILNSASLVVTYFISSCHVSQLFCNDYITFLWNFEFSDTT